MIMGRPPIPGTHQPLSHATLEVNLGAVAENYKEMRRRYEGTVLSAVVKNDGYGLGLEPIVRRLSAEGCTHFWVLDLAEGLRARASASDEAEICALHGLQNTAPEEFDRQRVVPVLATLEEVAATAAAARRLGRPIVVSVQLDTGLGRLGLCEAEVAILADRREWLDVLEIRTWVSHLASFDVPDAPSNEEQREKLVNWVGRLKPAPISLASSAGIYMGAHWHFDVARVGSALYGVQTSAIWQDGLRPCYTLRAPLLRVTEMPEGACVGYRRMTRLGRRSLIATAQIGYGNGLPQALAKYAKVDIAGHQVPIVGGIAMNLAMIDVTDVPRGLVDTATVATFLDERHTVDDLARQMDCAPNAILTQVGACTPRIYRD
ncbi:alanine racemase [Rhodoligotrophos appendicifer]|uniref:alanine racemase n=1 Tax=Rhodoligotrophos appendicifer TaxID=987056 RepID=UPI0014787F93|nr:alanine racemase [Rhodoligotrophos appendicifer]